MKCPNWKKAACSADINDRGFKPEYATRKVQCPENTDYHCNLVKSAAARARATDRKLLRVLKVLYQLNQEPVNLHNMQVTYKIGLRTAERDLQLLRLAGFDITTTGFPGEYKLNGGLKIAPAAQEARI